MIIKITDQWVQRDKMKNTKVCKNCRFERQPGLQCVATYQTRWEIISRHPSLTPICRDPHPLHHYMRPFNLTSRWWLEACEVCVSTCACVYRPLCVRCFSPYANHSLALRINLQMCHYPSGSAAITLQLHNSRLASWAPHTRAGRCMHTHVHTATHTHTCVATTTLKAQLLKMLHSER